MDETALCAHCGNGTSRDDASCASCGADPRLDSRYRLLRRLGSGAVGTTFAAVRESDGREVAVKELLVRRLEDFKAHDLFKREAGVLRTLRHHAVPAYVDDFAWGEGRQTGLYLVTELIDGETLEREAEQRRLSQKEVLGIVREVAEVLAFLHGLAPPVVHRDLKPSNVMRRRGDGSLVLIDFGAVKESVRRAGDGTTVSGTFGYMPPEQLAGRASPASDIYALGVLCVVLLTRMTPQELLDDQNRLQWQEHVTSEPLKALLARMLEHDPARRLGDAAAVARTLGDIIEGRAAAPPVRSGGDVFAPRGRAEQVMRAFGGGVMQRFGRWITDATVASEPGIAEPPPPTPRDIPPGFAGNAEPAARFFRIFGVLFGGIPLVLSTFLFSTVGVMASPILLFAAIGVPMAIYGFTRVARTKRLFREGVAVPATVTDAWLQGNVRINGRSPWKITIRYEVDDKQHSVTVSRFHVPPPLRLPGAQVYALYDPANPKRATLWPV